MEIYQNITWIMTDIKVGQLLAIDLAYQFVSTKYYFHAQDDFEFLRPGFIEYMLQALEYDPRLSSIYLANVPEKSKAFHIGPLFIQTQHQVKYYSGMTLSNSVHRLADYRLL